MRNLYLSVIGTYELMLIYVIDLETVLGHFYSSSENLNAAWPTQNGIRSRFMHLDFDV